MLSTLGLSKMYKLEIKPKTRKIFLKLAKRNQKLLEIIYRKILEIQENPFHSYKFLKEPLQGFNRVHVTGNFVLIFKIDHIKQVIDIKHYGHWDDVYKWMPKD